MKAIAPFDSVVIDGQLISSSALEPSSMSISITGDDKAMPSWDGHFVNVRSSIMKRASFRALGDFSSLTTPEGWPVKVSLFLGSEELLGFNALVSVSYDSDSRSSSFTMKGEPEVG